MRKAAVLALALAAPGLVAASGSLQAQSLYHLGRAATSAEIAAWDIDISPDGAGLPPGHGSVAEGKAIYALKCAACHGDHGQGKPMDALAGGLGTVFDAKSVRTVGSFWPYATTLYDYIRRAMPFPEPQSLSDSEVYAVSAYVLNLSGIVPDTAVLDAASLAKIVMPNRDRFVHDAKIDIGQPQPGAVPAVR
ncbi:MAG: cytochrome c [Beijerinckiaceae bacterium]|nr:cytochrome c [Beijerinckiaceae bacterium]